jgi:NADH-quinone oxidoreductase subunit L
MFLAALTCVIGFMPFSQFVTADGAGFAGHIEWSIASLSILVGVVGILIATFMYFKANDKPDRVALAVKGLYKASYNKFWFDEVWMFVTKKIIFQRISKPIAWFDRHIIDGFMNLLSTVTNLASTGIKRIQSGELQDYAWAFYMGAMVIVALVVFL